LAEALRGLGHTVATASDGPAALSACARTRFDAIVLDINLPGVDGIEIARRRLPCPIVRVRSAAPPKPLTTSATPRSPHGMDAFLEQARFHRRAVTHSRRPLATPANDIFARLDSPATLARARATLHAEWPALRAATATAVAGGDPAALRRLGHYLHTSALLLEDPALAELCARLADPAVQPSRSARRRRRPPWPRPSDRRDVDLRSRQVAHRVRCSAGRGADRSRPTTKKPPGPLGAEWLGKDATFRGDSLR